MTGWILCVITHIREDASKNSNGKHHFQINNSIKTLYDGLTEKELNETLDTFWSEYTKFNHKNDTFDSNKFIWSSKDISDKNSHLWNKKYSLPPTKFLVVVSFRVTSKIPGIGSAECSWGNDKTIKPGKISDLGNYISEKHSIVYTSACIEEAIIGRTLSNTYSKDGSHSHSWNDEDHDFDYKLDQWGV